jgi:hypothetical protein
MANNIKSYTKILTSALQRPQNASASIMQQRVVAAVRRLGLKFRENYVDATSRHNIDVLIDEDVAVDMCGPCHFLRMTQCPSGYTWLKRRVLERLGYRLVCVQFWDWNVASLLEDERAEERYIMMSLDSIVQVLLCVWMYLYELCVCVCMQDDRAQERCVKAVFG